MGIAHVDWIPEFVKTSKIEFFRLEIIGQPVMMDPKGEH
jgi:hypothetical protein